MYTNKNSSSKIVLQKYYINVILDLVFTLLYLDHFYKKYKYYKFKIIQNFQITIALISPQFIR